jgi:hypothetical protein
MLSVGVLLAGIAGGVEEVAAAETVQSEEMQSAELELGPRSKEESCMELARNDLLEIEFSATRAVDFNIHYHLDNQVRFPVNLKRQLEYADSYVAPAAREYCLMWTNRNDHPLRLRYQHQVRR